MDLSMSKRAVRKILREALGEDLGRRGDITTRLLIPKNLQSHAALLSKADGILCGQEVVRSIFRDIPPRVRCRFAVQDGKPIRKGQTLARLRGPARAILSRERVALNFLQHLSGVATLTRYFVNACQGTKVRIYDTRKTLPGLRMLEKYAVRCGGGNNHRMGLSDAILIKDNHSAALRNSAVGVRSWKQKIARFKKHNKPIPVEMEAKNLSQVRLALECRADIILLDNMPVSMLKKSIQLIRSAEGGSASAGRDRPPLIEVSGGITLKNVRRIARLGVDRISIGRLTHSAPSLDISLEMTG